MTCFQKFFILMGMKKHIVSALVAAAVAVACVGCASTKAHSSDSESETPAASSTSKTETPSDSAPAKTSSESTASKKTSSETNTKTVTIANPWSNFDRQEDAEDAAGTSFDIPSVKPFDYTRQVNRAIPGDILEIIYYNDVDDDEVRLRKEKIPLADGSTPADISGDYNKDLVTKNMSADSKRVELRGEVDNYHVATWTDGDYAYAVTSKSGISEEEMLDFISELY